MRISWLDSEREFRRSKGESKETKLDMTNGIVLAALKFPSRVGPVFAQTSHPLSLMSNLQLTYEETCNSDVRLHAVSPLVCVLSARKLEGVNTVTSATMPMQR